ncbi:HSF-type DNA-binding domain protein [Ancylostoma ceylanicum]|uniref:HSF-type DNA-binding domain protein n=1 Tax=Ancylostoma ceylanicum TaxID=53326 RepID=A0A0D6M4C6_9BILA|nr:HSF-type DNA-binding domain protein [Ancylostoma ceylanicum]
MLVELTEKASGRLEWASRATAAPPIFSRDVIPRGREALECPIPVQYIQNGESQSSRSTENSINGVQAQASIQMVMEELRQMREKQRAMDNKMHDLVKENEQLWEQVTLLRAQHNRQQQVVTKLVQFLVAMMQPNSTAAKRVMKRGVLAIDEPPQKRMRMNQNSNSTNISSLTDILDRLQREMQDIGGIRGVAAAASRGDGPIIADVTDEWVPGASSSGSPQNQVGQKNKQQYGNNGYNISYSSPTSQPSPSPTSNGPSSVGIAAPRRQQNGSVTSTTTPNQQQTPGTSYSSTITMSPQLERQFSQDFQDFLNGIDLSIDNCRDLLGNHWDFNLFDNVDTGEEQEQVQPAKPPVENNTTNTSFGNYGVPFGTGQQQLTYHSSPQLALEGGPLTSTNSTAPFNNGEPQVEPLDETRPEVNPTLEFPDTPLIGGDDLLFPNTPVLLTPCTSPRP